MKIPINQTNVLLNVIKAKKNLFVRSNDINLVMQVQFLAGKNNHTLKQFS